MDAVEFLKIESRMCSEHTNCKECPVSSEKNGVGETCSYLRRFHTEKYVSAVEKWSKEHPIKTRQSEFLKMFPDVKIQHDVIDIGPCILDKKIKDSCGRNGTCFDCRKKYWNL